MGASISLSEFINDFGAALKLGDARQLAHKHFRPGIGPFGEADTIKIALKILKEDNPKRYSKARTKRHPDLLIPNEWQIEFKVVRPFGDNGREAENWSQNVLHPYPGHISSLGDCLTLLDSTLVERRAIVVYGYEHEPPRISLEPCISGFEILAHDLLAVKLSERLGVVAGGLIHPVHQVLKIYAWEIQGHTSGARLSSST